MHLLKVGLKTIEDSAKLIPIFWNAWHFGEDKARSDILITWRIPVQKLHILF